MRISILLSYFVLVGCGSSGHSPPVNLSGNWTGMLSSSNPFNSRTLDVFMTQNGSLLNGPRLQVGTIALCYGDFGTLSGNVSNGQTTFNIVIPPSPPSGEQELTLTGAAQSNTVSGTYTETAGCLKGDAGTFQISPAPSITSSQWSGTWSGPYGSTGTAAANLVEDSSANLTGTLTLNGGVCDGFGSVPENVSGNLTGLFILTMAANTPSGSWATGGKLDIGGKTLTLSHVCADSLDRVMEIDLTHP